MTRFPQHKIAVGVSTRCEARGGASPRVESCSPDSGLSSAPTVFDEYEWRDGTGASFVKVGDRMLERIGNGLIHVERVKWRAWNWDAYYADHHCEGSHTSKRRARELAITTLRVMKAEAV